MNSNTPVICFESQGLETNSLAQCDPWTSSMKFCLHSTLNESETQGRAQKSPLLTSLQGDVDTLEFGDQDINFVCLGVTMAFLYCAC